MNVDGDDPFAGGVASPESAMFPSPAEKTFSLVRSRADESADAGSAGKNGMTIERITTRANILLASFLLLLRNFILIFNFLPSNQKLFKVSLNPKHDFIQRFYISTIPPPYINKNLPEPLALDL